MALLYLDILPEELKEYLIKFCDGKSLISLSNVSDDWRSFMLKFSKSMLKQWGRVVSSEIPIDFIIDILQSLYPNYWVKGVEVNWSDIYVSWYLWRDGFEEINFDVSSVHHINLDITSILFSGEWIVIGTREGVIEAVNCENGQILEVLRKCGAVKNMYLRCTSSKKHGRIMDSLDHNELIVTTPYRHLLFNFNSGRISEYGKLKGSLALRHFEGCRVEVDVQLCNSKIICKHPKRVCQTLYEDYMCNVLQVWNEKILVLFDTGQLQVLDYCLKEVRHPINDLILNPQELLFEKQFYIWHLDVIFILGDINHSDVLFMRRLSKIMKRPEDTTIIAGRYFDVYVGYKSARYYTLRDMGANVSSILYHAGILFLGCDEGCLYTFRVNSDEELLTLNLREPLCRVNVTGDSSKPIIALALQEVAGARPILAAASQHEIFLISGDK